PRRAPEPRPAQRQSVRSSRPRVASRVLDRGHGVRSVLRRRHRHPRLPGFRAPGIRLMRRGFAYLLLAFAALGVGSARARLVDIDAATRGTRELLYLPNGKHLKAMS